MRARIVTLALLPLLVLAVGCGSAKSSSSGAKTGPCTYRSDGTTPSKPVTVPPSTPDPKAATQLTISTNQGDIPIVLEPGTAPCAVNSFVSLAAQGYFDNTPCHRLVTEGAYVLQCGDPSGTGRGGPGYGFDDELVANDPRLQPCGQNSGVDYCTYNTGTVAMANRGANTNGSQFFLVYGNSRFPPSYTILGHMDASGVKVVRQIAAIGIGTTNGLGPGDGSPKNPVNILSVK